MNVEQRIIVLRSFKHGESDLIIHGLNPRGARMGFIAKGGAKSRKRFPGGILEAGNYIEIVYREKSGGDDGDPLHLLLEATLKKEFPKLRTDYDRLNAALQFLKLMLKVSAPGVIDSPELFNLLGNALGAAETSTNIERLRVHFELKVLAIQGVLPHEDQFMEWINTPLAAHETIAADREWQGIAAQVHDHMRMYLGR